MFHICAISLGAKMTHDEFLTKLEQRYWKMFNHNSQDQTESGIEHRILIQNQYFALRAVVELHKPRTTQLTPDFEYTNCVCGNDYPCPTIQAIEKELQ